MKKTINFNSFLNFGKNGLNPEENLYFHDSLPILWTGEKILEELETQPVPVGSTENYENLLQFFIACGAGKKIVCQYDDLVKELYYIVNSDPDSEFGSEVRKGFNLWFIKKHTTVGSFAYEIILYYNQESRKFNLNEKMIDFLEGSVPKGNRYFL